MGDFKEKLRLRSINAICHWLTQGPHTQYAHRQSETILRDLGVTPVDIEYGEVTVCPEFYRPEMAEFNDLVCWMLTVAAQARPTIQQVLAHPFFVNMTSPMYASITRPCNVLGTHEKQRLQTQIQKFTQNREMQRLARDIYCRCNDLMTRDERVRVAACVWIAGKLVTGTVLKMPMAVEALVDAERDICHNLLFRLCAL